MGQLLNHTFEAQEVHECVLSGVQLFVIALAIACQDPLSMEQARILEQVVISSSRGIFPSQGLNPGPCISSRFFTAEPPGKPQCNYIRQTRQNVLNISLF